MAGYRLSVVVPAWNEEKAIALLLGDLRRQSLPETEYEIIVVDGGSTDSTVPLMRALAATMPNLRIATNPKRWSSAGRNLGAALSSAPFLLFVDAHCRISSRSMLADVLAAFEDGAQCVSRPQPLVPSDERALSRSIAATRSTAVAHVPGSMIFRQEACWADPSSAGCGYSRQLFSSLDGFDESFDACEDVDFNLRVRDRGIAARHSPRFAVSYFARATWRDLARQMYRYGVGRGRLARKRGRLDPAAAYVPALLVGLFALSGASAFVCPHSALVALPAMAALIVAALVSAFAVARQAGVSVGALSAVSFLVIFLSAGAGSLAGLLRPFAGNQGAAP